MKHKMESGFMGGFAGLRVYYVWRLAPKVQGLRFRAEGR